MRRRGLRDRIRHQRRLTRRLATRHVMARRSNPVARMLEALGAWYGDESPATMRFVPPLSDAEIAPIYDRATAATADDTAWTRRATPSFVDDDAEPDLADAVTAPWPATQAKAPLRRVPEPSTPRQVEGPPSSKPVERPASPPNAPRDSIVTPARPAAPAVSRDSLPTPLQADESAASQVVPDAGIATPDVAATTIADSVARVASGSIDKAPSTAIDARLESVPTAPIDVPPTAEKSTHAEIVQRALGALRATGELAPSKRPSGGPAAPTQSTTPSVPASAAPPPSAPVAPPAPRRSAAPPPAPPSPVTSTSVRLPVDQPRDAAEVAPAVAPPIDAAPASSPLDDVAALDVRDASNIEREVAPHAAEPTATGAEPTEPAVAEQQVDARPPTPSVNEQRPKGDEHLPRVAEQRQARRPAHLDRPRAEAAASTAVPARERTPAAPRAAPSAPVTEKQFHFADVERTPQEWRRLLIEATTPPRPGARRAPPAAPDSRAAPRPGTPPSAERPTAQRPANTPPAPSRSTAPSPAGKQPLPSTASRATPARPAEPPGAPPGGRTPNDVTARPTAPSPVEPRVSHTAPPARSTSIARDEPTARSVTADASALAPSGPEQEPAAGYDEREAVEDDPRVESAPMPRGSEASAGVGPVDGAAESQAASPAPLSPSTRRFLRPLVGIDPDTVRIHRGTRAEALADAHQADAVAVRDDVVLGAGHDEREPDTIALVAHELTHAARARDRRFVPPIARDARASQAPTSSAPERGRSGFASKPLAVDDEEALAQVVEARVRAAATREREQRPTVVPNADRDTDVDFDRDADLESDLHGPTADAPTSDVSASHGPRARRAAPTPPAERTRRSQWGALPAPWEPLPPSIGSSRPVTSPATVASSPSPASPASDNGATTAPAVRTAERGRESAGEEPPHADPPDDDGAKGPDIDVLARQVYDVLKRRLAAERRRGA